MKRVSFFKFSLLLILTSMLSGCVGTVEDLQQVDNSQVKPPVKFDFNGVDKCYSISHDKIDVRFKDAKISSGSSLEENLIYQTFLNGDFTKPITSSGLDTLRKDAEGYYHLTLDNLSINTKYSITVKVFDPESNEKDKNFESCIVKTLGEKFPIFDGLQAAAPVTGILGQTKIQLQWNKAQPAQLLLGKFPDTGYKITKYKVFWSSKSADPETMEALTELAADNSVDLQKFDISDLQPGATYYYMVRAIDESNREEKNIKVLEVKTRSPSSVTFDGIKTAEVPKNISGYNSIKLSWEPALGDFDRYKLFAFSEDDSTFALTSVDPNNNALVYGEVTDTSRTSINVLGLNAKKKYNFFVVACMWNPAENKCSTYAGHNKKLTSFTEPPLSPFAGIQKVEKLQGAAGLTSVRLSWNKPSTTLGVCSSINLSHFTGGTEAAILNCTNPSYITGTPCYSSAPTCDDTDIVVSGLSAETEFCYKAVVSEGGRFQESTKKNCYTSTINKPIFDGPPTCSPLEGGTKIEVSWPTPTNGDYQDYQIAYEKVSDSDTGTLNSNAWMADMIAESPTSSRFNYVSSINKALNKKTIKSLAPDSRYRFGLKTVLRAGTDSYYDDNTSVIECRTSKIKAEFQGWSHILSIGPRVDGISGRPKPENIVNTGGKLVPNIESSPNYYNSTALYPANSGQCILNLRKNATVHLDWVLDTGLNAYPTIDTTKVSEQEYRIEITHDNVSGYTTCNYLNASIRKDATASSLVELSSSNTSSSSYAISTNMANKLTSIAPLSANIARGTDASGNVTLAWNDFKTSDGKTISEFITASQLTEESDDGYYVFRKVLPLGDNQADYLANFNVVTNAGSGWEILNESAPITRLTSTKLYIDKLPTSFHPMHSTAANITAYDKQNTGKVVWYTVRYKLAGKFLDFTLDGKSIDGVTTVIIPPANMASIHPWIANMLMCKQMGITEYDRQNNYRCEFGGIGSTPDPKDENKSHYDVGGHVLVDRFQLGCNLDLDTNSSSSGITSKHNAVLYMRANNRCYYNLDNRAAGSTAKFSNWKYQADTTGTGLGGNTLDTVQLPQTIQNEFLGRKYPGVAGKGGHGTKLTSNNSNLPPLTGVTPVRSHYLCQSHAIALENGSPALTKVRKRLLSSREYQHMAMPSMLRPNDSDTGCLTGTTTGNTTVSSESSYSSSRPLTQAYTQDIIGSSYEYRHKYLWRTGNSRSKECVSGFGVQDYIGVSSFLNDQALCIKNVAGDNATCKIYPSDQEKEDFKTATNFTFPTNQFVDILPADYNLYKDSAKDTLYSWSYYSNPSQTVRGKSRAIATTETYVNGSTSHVYGEISPLYKANRKIFRPIEPTDLFSFVIGQPITCQNNSCNSDTDRELVTNKTSASDYGADFITRLQTAYATFYPIESKTLPTADQPFVKFLTTEAFSDVYSTDYQYTSSSYRRRYNNYTYQPVSDPVVVLDAANVKKRHHRFALHWDYGHLNSSRAVGIRCGVKVELNVNGTIKKVDDQINE